ncbi:hypothetical protein F5887DRAFT_1073240 [Amanita rubescens]|nr:hypothetical protein F5887DRAFT_1073240 [Amanita rubescens]
MAREVEEGELVPAEPKAKNPLDDLPKSNFNLEEWKCVYSNRTRAALVALSNSFTRTSTQPVPQSGVLISSTMRS